MRVISLLPLVGDSVNREVHLCTQLLRLVESSIRSMKAM